MNSGLNSFVSFFNPLFIKVSPIGERHSVDGDINFTSRKAFNNFLAFSRSISFGDPATLALLTISLALFWLIEENSFLKKEVIFLESVVAAILMMVPSSTPYGWGFISSAFFGSLSVALSNIISLPSGSMRIIWACGFTMAQLLKYSFTDCFLFFTYLPSMTASIRVPDSFSQWSISSDMIFGLFFFVSITSSHRWTGIPPPIFDDMMVGYPVESCE